VEPYLHSPSTPSWRGAQLKHRGKFTFTLPFHYYPPIYFYVAQVVSSSQVYLTFLYEFLTAPLRATCPTHLMLLDLISLMIRRAEIMKLLSMSFSPSSCYFVSLRFRHSSRHFVCLVQDPYKTTCKLIAFVL
jgi:hypothetical protein